MIEQMWSDIRAAKRRMKIYNALACIPECWLTKPLLEYVARKAAKEIIRMKEIARQAAWRIEYLEGELARARNEEMV